MTLFSQQGNWEGKSLRDGKQQGDNYQMKDSNIGGGGRDVKQMKVFMKSSL